LNWESWSVPRRWKQNSCRRVAKAERVEFLIDPVNLRLADAVTEFAADRKDADQFR
jgi:hypothetical protein